MPNLEPGTIFDGLYRLDRLLGVGGVGAVYAAWHLQLSRPVAIKVLHPQFASHQEPLQRFLREAQILSKLGHESFVTVYDFSYSREGTPYLIMELVEGENLRARLSRGPLPIEEALSFFRPLCEALSRAHQQQILHRDLKPDNLMLTPAGSVKILDFGMAKLISDEVPLTADKVVMGTPYYMAPERARGQRVAEPSSDVFSLGAILYEVLTGHMAFGAESPIAAMYRVIRDPVPPLKLADEALGQRLDEVIKKACAKSAANRYQRADAMWTALAAAVDPHAAPPPAAEDRATAGKEDPTVDGFPPIELDSRDDLAGAMKAGIFHAIFDYIHSAYGEDGLHRLYRKFGDQRTRQLLSALPTAWIDLTELNDLHDAIIALFDDGSLRVMRNLGRHFAEIALASTYRAFLLPGSPETFVRRAQMMFRAWNTLGDTQVKRVGAERWHMRMVGVPAMSALRAATAAGVVERYLELAGATNIRVEESCTLAEGQPVGDLYLSFSQAA